jgi:hypothetical protein
MTSELRVDNLKGSTTGGSINVLGEGTSATTNLQQGLAKHLCHLDQSDHSIKASFNNTSVTDIGTGITQCNLTNNLQSANDQYGTGNHSGWETEMSYYIASSLLTSSYAQRLRKDDSTYVDTAHVFFVLHGSLA